MLEVMMAIAEARGYNWEDILSMQQSKHEKRGGFSKKIILLSTEEDADDEE
jgi:predicted house-cleaning noncanonical NTP pyrophosphatase (MazG superfamily)